MNFKSWIERSASYETVCPNGSNKINFFGQNLDNGDE